MKKFVRILAVCFVFISTANAAWAQGCAAGNKDRDAYLEKIRVNERDFKSCFALGDLYANDGCPGHALRFYDKGLEILKKDINLKAEHRELFDKYERLFATLEKKNPYRRQGELISYLNKREATRLGVLPKIDVFIEFDFDKGTINEDSKAQLDTVADVFKKDIMKPYKFIIQGHTDPVGGDAYNMLLSEGRAKSVEAYLLNQSVPGDAVFMSEGKGKTQLLPREDGETDEAWHSRNRRVVFISCDKSDTREECMKKAGENN